MKTTVVLTAVALTLSAMLWAADDAEVARQPVANRQSLIANRSDALAIPQVLSYQGRLTDAKGVPVPDGDYSITFKLYTVPNGGSPFWSETQNVTTRDGLFSVLLGSVTPITTGWRSEERGMRTGGRNGGTGDEGPGTRDEGPGTRDEGPKAAYLGMVVEGSAEMVPRMRIAGGYTLPNEGVGANDNRGGGTDNDDEWVRSSPADSVLYTIRRLGIARGGCSNVLYGNYTCSMTNLGSSCTTGISGSGGASLGNMAVLGGYGNRAWAPYTSVGGGRNNKAGNDATDTSAIVVGGYGNQANGKFSAVIAGQNNTASGLYSTVPGGYGDTCAGDYGMTGGYSTRARAAADYTFAFGENCTTSTPRAVVFYHSGGATKLGVGVQNPVWNMEVAGKGKFTGKLRAAAGYKADTAVADSEWATKGYVNTHGGGGGGDNAWVRQSSDSVLYTIRNLGIARGGAGNVLYSTNRFTDVNFGTACTTGKNGADCGYATVGGGYANAARGWDATVAGGIRNVAEGAAATVGGGTCDTAKALYSSAMSGYSNLAGDQVTDSAACVAGGYDNSATSDLCFVGGGLVNIASDHCATVSGGSHNAASQSNATVGGGYMNTASGYTSAIAGGGQNTANSYFGTIAGGYGNRVDSSYAMVGGGRLNLANNNYATVAGGDNNVASGPYSAVGGGYHNDASIGFATVGGGMSNIATGDLSTVGGGDGNDASGAFATVGGGIYNTASGSHTTVAGGDSNVASDDYSAVGGGYHDAASGDYATVGGGSQNAANNYNATVGGGYQNVASGYAATVGGGGLDTASNDYSTVPGGYMNAARGSFSLAAGRRAKAAHSGAFVWGDATDADFTSTASNQFLIRAAGGVGINKNEPGAALDVYGKANIDGKLRSQNVAMEASATGDTYTSSTMWADMPGMLLTFNTDASHLLINFAASNVYLSSFTYSAGFRMLLDGEQIAYCWRQWADTYDEAPVVFLRMPSVSAGQHTVEVQWRTSETGWWLHSNGTRTLTVVEF